MLKTVVLPIILAAVCTVITLHGLHVSSAQVMQSGSYQIQSDSINVGGNDLASSSNYWVRSTIGEVGTGESSSETYTVGAGYRQMQDIYLSLSGATNVTMDTTIPGVTGGEANGSTTVTVITDSPSGYVLTIEAENDPAMWKGAESIDDYAPGASPSFDFDVAAGEAYLGFTPEGVDVTPRYRDDGGSDCNTGGTFDTPSACWDGLSQVGQTIASKTDPNHPDGSTTTVRFRVGVGGGVNLDPGFYVATTTLTALPL